MANIELTHKIQGYTPEQCAEIVTRPSSEIYYALKQRIQKSDPPWIRSFVDHFGLVRLVDTLVILSQDRQKMPWTSVCDAILQLDCIGCVREVVNFNEGMEYLVSNSGLVDKLVLALDTPNVYPKKQLLELLTSVAIAREEGHQSVLHALENYKKVKHQAHEFTIIIHEIKLAENTHYRTTLLAFINALIQCTPNLRNRCRIRNQFIGLKILDVINFMKKDEKDAEFCIQMQIFYSGKQTDEAELLQVYNIDVYNPKHIFEEVHDKLVGCPEMSCFLHVLQDIYRLNTTLSDRSLMWQTLERVTYAISNLQCEKDTQRFLNYINNTLEKSKTNNKQSPISTHDEVRDKSLQCDNINKIPMNEDELLSEMLSGSPEFTSLSNGDNKFPNVNEENEQNDRRDSGVSMRSCSSPNTGCYSDYDNIGENNVPLSDVFNQQQYLPSSKGKYPPGKDYYHQYHTLPAIEETEMDCIDEEVENNKNNIENLKIFRGRSRGNGSVSDDEPIRPTSLEIVKRTIHTETYPGETSVIDNVNFMQQRSHTLPNLNNRNVVRNSSANNKDVSLFKKMCQDKMAANMNNNSNQRSSTCSVTKEVKWVRVPESKSRLGISMWSQMNEFGSNNIPVDMTKLQREFVDITPQSLDNADDELSLLNADSTLALNLFLARLETNPDYVAGCVREGEVEELGVEAVRHLLHALPSDQELNQIRNYTISGGSLYDLAPPDQLLTMLSSIPGYRLQLDALVFHSDFTSKFCKLHEAFDSLFKACKDVINCHSLRDFMKYALKVGNFLNKDTNTGKVDGVALSTWHRMSQVTSSCNHDSLLTWVIKHICDTDDSILSFVTDIPTLKNAASCDFEDMKAEVNELNLQMKKFVTKLTMAPPAICHKYDKIMAGVTKDLQCLQDQIQGIKYVSTQLMAYFCEDEATFDVQKCLKTLYDFINLVQTQKKESMDRDNEGQLAGMRVKQMIDQQIDQYFADIFTQNEVAMSETPPTNKKFSKGLVDRLLEKLHQGNIEPNYLEKHEGPDYKHLQSFIMPEHKEERFSPDRDIAPDIPLHSTPSKPDETVLEIPELKELHEKKTYADKADQHIKEQYRKDNQALSSSFLIQNPSNPSPSEDFVPPKDPLTRPVPGNRQGHRSCYDNFQDMDVILMDLDTCVDKVNHEIEKLENAKKTVIRQQSNKDAVYDKDPETATTEGDKQSGPGMKFYFGLPTPGELKSKASVPEKQTQITQPEESTRNTNKDRTDNDIEDKVESATPATAGNEKLKPTSKLGILKRFSKAVLRQRDGNIQTTETNKESLKRPASDPVYENKTALQPVTKTKSVDGSSSNINYRKSEPRSKQEQAKNSNVNIGTGKENNRSKYQLGRFGFGSFKEHSSKSNFDQNQKKLTKSVSHITTNNSEFEKKGPLKKTYSVPSHGANGKNRNKSEAIKMRSESDRFLDTKGPDRPASKQLNFNVESTRSRAGSLPAFSRRNALPQREKNNSFKAKQSMVDAVLQKSNSDTVIANKSVELPSQESKFQQPAAKEITVKPSYSLTKDEEVTDRILDSKNIRYRSSSLPVQKQGKSGVPKPSGSLKEKRTNTGQSSSTTNRFGFVKKDKKSVGASDRVSVGGAAVIPTAPKHELAQAQKCTLKIYRKYDLP